MYSTEKEKFESLWADFIALVKGKLISTAAKQNLSTPLANLILFALLQSVNNRSAFSAFSILLSIYFCAL